MIADPKSEKTLARIASALETSFVFKGIEPSVLQQVGSSLDHLHIIWHLQTHERCSTCFVKATIARTYYIPSSCVCTLPASHVVNGSGDMQT